MFFLHAIEVSKIWTECLNIRTSNIRTSAPSVIFCASGRNYARAEFPHSHSHDSLTAHDCPQDVAWASALMSRARWFATSSGRPHATIVSARWALYDAFHLRAPHLFKVAVRSFEKDNAVHPPTIAVSFTQIRIGTIPCLRSTRPSLRLACVFH